MATMTEITDLIQELVDEEVDSAKGDYGYCPNCERRDCDDCNYNDCDDCDTYCGGASDCDAVSEAYDDGYAKGWNAALATAAKELNLGDYLDKFKKEC